MKGKLYFFYAHLYGGILLVAAVPFVALLAAIGVSDRIYMMILYCMLGVGVWSGLIVMMFLLFGNSINSVKVMQKAEKVPSPFRRFEDFRNILGTHLQREYTHHEAAMIGEFGYIELFARRTSYDEIKCITIVHIPELNYGFLERGNDVVQKLLENFCGTRHITNRIIMTSFFCVDRVSPAFYDVVNNSELLDYKVRYLPIGISFGKKNVYIANPKRHSRWYKTAREEVIQFLSTQGATQGDGSSV